MKLNNEEKTILDELSIFVLAYNEEENIQRCLLNVIEAAKKHVKKYEILVVFYDGTKDNTLNIIEKMQQQYPFIKVVHQKIEEKGYGTALRLGINHAQYRYIFYTDGDNQFNVKEINRLIPFLSSYDIISGYRQQRQDPKMRIFTAKVYNWIINCLFFTHFRDVDSAFKIYKKDIFTKFKIISSSGAADAEILLKTKRKGYKILEVPVSHYSRYAGKPIFEGDNTWGLIKPGVIFRLLKDLFRLRILLFFNQFN